MGIARLQELDKDQELLQELRRMLVTSAGQDKPRIPPNPKTPPDHDGSEDNKLVCVTSGVSFLGLAIVNRLLPRGYSVRIIVDNSGAQEMYKRGMLATVDAMRLAEAHVRVYEAMNKSASGRYICFDNVIETEKQAEVLAGETGLSKTKICGIDEGSNNVHHPRYELSKKKLTNLLSRRPRSCYNQNQQFY